MTIWWKIIDAFYKNPYFKEKYFTRNSERKNYKFSWTYFFWGPAPILLHQTMFTNSIDFLANKE